MQIQQWVKRTSGFDGWWEALQFDRAVTYAGRYIENKLNEMDSKGNHTYTIEQILGETSNSNQQAGLAGLIATFGVITRD